MEQSPQAHAWNPGLQSDIPRELWPLVTLFRPENATVTYPVAKELADLTGLKVLDLFALRPERLVVHALLVRVTADLSVPDGPNYEDLGINLRAMVERIHVQHIVPDMDRIVAAFDTERDRARQFISDELSQRLFDRQSPADAQDTVSTGFWQRLFGAGKTKTNAQVATAHDAPDLLAVNEWKQTRQTINDPLHVACIKALIKVVDGMVSHRGRVIPDKDLVTNIAVNLVSNSHGADVIDNALASSWQTAVQAEGFRFLPAQEKPVIMNVKGASASGKSTIRPRQRHLAESLGIPWEDFALISPDYWRKYLLDYASLGDSYQYGAMLTGRELVLIDKKLDRYMAQKAANGTISHLLIDRFRFDSFVVDIDRTADSKLLSRFGDRVYLFFMVTHPSETVERAWSRGLKTGRYKAVDDLLYHNVEAFTGMPSLFLSWVTSNDKQVHFEFLDNDVAIGELPRTAAFGWNHRLVILDVRLFVNIDRYRKVDITARQASDIFKPEDLDADGNTQFIVRCAERVAHIVFADAVTGELYAEVRDATLTWWDSAYIQSHRDVEGLLQTLGALGYSEAAELDARAPVPAPLDRAQEKAVTVGQWGC